jgi:hypothetical protein
MQVNYNYNWQECIGDPGGLVQRNLWSYLESYQLTPTTKTYDSGSGIWYDNGRWGNNAFVQGNKNTISKNTGSWGGYNVVFAETDYLSWASQYNTGPVPPTFQGQCIFIQWQNSQTTSSISLFNRSGFQADSSSQASFWGGSNLSSGNSYEYLGWPEANQQTSNQNPLLALTDKTAMYMQNLLTPDANGSNIFAYNTGAGMNVSGSQVVCAPFTVDGGGPLYIKNNPYVGGFDFTNNYLQFGKKSVMPYPFVGPDGSQITYAFKGAVKRILIYNSVLSGNEIAQNWKYLQTLP